MDAEPSCVETPATLRALKSALHGHGDAPRRKEEEEESKYADLELGYARTGGTGAGRDRRFGTRNQTSVCFPDERSAAAPRATQPKPDMAIKRDMETMEKGHSGVGGRKVDTSSSSVHHLLHAETEEEDKRARVITQPDGNDNTATTQGGGQGGQGGQLHCGDFYLSWRSESDEEEEEDVTVLLCDDGVPRATEDESQYITTHEIQLCELSDHEGDSEPGVGSSTSWEEDNQVYTFVDYAALHGDGAVGERNSSSSGGDGGDGGAATVSTLLESDLCDVAKISGSDESGSKIQQQRSSGSSAGQIHLSITATSRAINDPGSVQDEGNVLYHARRSADMGRYVLRGVDAKAETLRDKAKCFIALPGRVHFGGRLRRKEVTGCGSSGASSAVSELDDADKEVRSLTAKAFKSLAYPYLDAFGFSSSSESSASERGVNRWSTFVDLKYGNMSVPRHHQGPDQSHKRSFGLAKNLENIGYKGIALASIKPPSSSILALRGDPHSASSSTKKIELMGKFSQGHSGVITLTETLNFRCNVNSGMPGGERRADFAQNAAGSRSTDEVTDSFPSAQRREASKPPPKTMEGAHKKAVFASSLLKNVISKKMQFEQERKMERGEISEPLHAPSPCFVHHESDGAHRGRGSRELHTQSSRASESSSDYTIMCLDELGDIVDSGSCDTKSDSRRRDAPESHLEPPASEVGVDTKKGAWDASKNTLLRSQNSAFRCWKDEELEFQRDRKSDQTPEEKPPSVEGDQSSADSGKATKMSHLFVPSIQVLQSDGDAAEQLQRRGGDSPRGGEEGDATLRPDNTLGVADSRRTTSKSPEIKINLRSVRDNKAEPFSVSRLHAPNIGVARADELKSQTLKGESSDKVPHFMVRDVRDNKGKLQTPIHQVRDVRKLVKSSYHFVSLDNNVTSAESHQEHKKQMPQRNLNSVSPIVIKCQSVNTNSNAKQCGSFDLSKQETLDLDRSSPEGAKSIPLQWAAGRAAVHDSSEGGMGSKTESRLASKKLEKISDVTEKKPESKMANQGALEKLQAAVKTMEQLYVFDKNEWKRKNKPLILTDSHVLPLLVKEGHGRPEEDGARGFSVDKVVRGDKTPPSASSAAAAVGAAAAALLSGENLPKRDDKDLFKDLPTSGGFDDRFSAKTAQTTGTASGSKNISSLSSSLKASASTKVTPPNGVTQTPFSAKHFVPKSPKLPMSLKVSQPRYSRNEGAAWKEVDRPSQDNENYMTIPLKSQASSSISSSSSSRRPAPADKTPSFTATTPPGYLGSGTRGLEDHSQTPKHSGIVTGTCSPEIPSATIYHSLPLGMPAVQQPQMYCFSPAITPAPTVDPFQAMQRKMLLDPTTGNYYLVDTPVQPATKRLFDPETGQYVDVPMPQPPMTPMPMSISPLALSPGAYGHTYMIYPGFMPTPSVIPARTLVQSQMSMHSEAERAEKAPPQQTEAVYMESPFYMATGKSPHAAFGGQPPATASRPAQGFKQPVISITSQQGPRIIAPPSFDGTTMSFVVEHR